MAKQEDCIVQERYAIDVVRLFTDKEEYIHPISDYVRTIHPSGLIDETTKLEDIKSEIMIELSVVKEIRMEPKEIPLSDHFEVSKIFTKKICCSDERWTYRYRPTCEEKCSCRTSLDFEETIVQVPVETSYLFKNQNADEIIYHDLITDEVPENPIINTKDKKVILVQKFVSYMNEDGSPLYIIHRPRGRM